MLNILNLIDDARCFETIRAMHWPQGVICPHCDSPQVTKQGHDESRSRNDKSMSAPSVGSGSTTSPGRSLPVTTNRWGALDALPLFYGA